MAEKMFQPAYGCCKHPKAGRNTQQKQFEIKIEIESSKLELINTEIDLEKNKLNFVFESCLSTLYPFPGQADIF